MKPFDGKETSVIGVRTIFAPNGRLSCQYEIPVNLKASKSRGVISFFTQESDKAGITVRIDELQKFLSTL